MHNESHGWDNWSFTDAGPAGWQGGIEVNIVNDTHPIVVDANVSIGPMQFFDPRGEWTTELVSALAPGAVSIAELIPEGSTDVYAIIFAIEKGAELANGTPATARAVGFSLPGQAFIEPDVMTPEGWALWDASIAWLDPPAPAITVGPIDTMVATGDEGDILSINGIDVNDMILGTSTYGDPSVASRDASNADDFSLATLASADSQEYMQTLFDQAVTSIFIVEFRGDDSGYVQALDAMGDPIESMVEFGPDDFSDTGYNSIHSVYTRAMVIRSEIPIYGIQLITIPGAEWGLSIDPLCIAAVPAP
jgi:hypothetical protein